jgi:hypothetical protein
MKKVDKSTGSLTSGTEHSKVGETGVPNSSEIHVLVGCAHGRLNTAGLLQSQQHVQYLNPLKMESGMGKAVAQSTKFVETSAFRADPRGEAGVGMNKDKYSPSCLVEGHKPQTFHQKISTLKTKEPFKMILDMDKALR